jgi:hypothetical protein
MDFVSFLASLVTKYSVSDDKTLRSFDVSACT